jgi:hypothetical protein
LEEREYGDVLNELTSHIGRWLEREPEGKDGHPEVVKCLEATARSRGSSQTLLLEVHYPFKRLVKES